MCFAEIYLSLEKGKTQIRIVRSVSFRMSTKSAVRGETEVSQSTVLASFEAVKQIQNSETHSACFQKQTPRWMPLCLLGRLQQMSNGELWAM